MGLNQCTDHYVGIKKLQKLQKLDEFKRFAMLRKGIGIESQNLCKQFYNLKTIETR